MQSDGATPTVAAARSDATFAAQDTGPLLMQEGPVSVLQLVTGVLQSGCHLARSSTRYTVMTASWRWLIR